MFIVRDSNPPETRLLANSEKAARGISQAALLIVGAPRGIRTLDLEIRSLLLYPAELWAHACWRMDDYSLWTRARRSWARILSNTVVVSMTLSSNTSSYPHIRLSRISISCERASSLCDYDRSNESTSTITVSLSPSRVKQRGPSTVVQRNASTGNATNNGMASTCA